MPRLIPSNQVAMAINLTFRNGLPKTRPVWHRVPLSFPTDAIKKNATTQLFQCASFHQAYGSGENCILALIGGHLFRFLVGSSNVVQDVSIQIGTYLDLSWTAPAINSSAVMTVVSTAGIEANDIISIQGGNCQVITVINSTQMLVRNLDFVAGTFILKPPPGDPQVPVTVYTDLNNSINPNAWMWQAEDFTIVNNGQANPLFFDGAGTRRSAGTGGEELPAGCMGAYVNGRVWMTLPGVSQQPSQQFMAGDLVYSHGFNDGYGGRSAVLKTEENTFLSGGGAFSVPVEAGSVTAMSSVAIADTSLGQGALQVMTAGSVFSVQVPFLREDWATTQYPLMTVGLPGYGALSQLSVVRVNGDLWYRSHDGLRSYQVGRRDLGTWVNTPLSVEVEQILNLDNDLLLSKSNGILFDNRLLQTCSPLTTDRGIAHRGLVALDFNGISTLTSRSEPAYDGLWTGLRLLQLVKGTFNGQERCFAFAVDACERICLYELLRDNTDWFDNDGTQRVPVQSSFESRSMGWSDNGNRLKKLNAADVYLDRLAGNPGLAFDFKYRSDEDPTWQDWHAFTLCAPVEDCTTAGCPTFDNVREQYRTFIRIPDPSDECSQITKRMKRTGYEFQVRMAWTGFAQLNRLHVWSAVMSDSVVVGCPSSETCILLKGCDEPWFSYEIETTCDDPIEVTGVPPTAAPEPGPTTRPWNPPDDLPEPNAVPEPTCLSCTVPVWPPPYDVGEPIPACRTCGDDPGTGRPPPNPVGEPTPGGDPSRQAPCGNTYNLGPTLAKEDPQQLITRAVGVSGPIGVDPSTLLEPGVLSAWSADVWAAWAAYKLANPWIVPTDEFITWRWIVDTGLNWNANQVYTQPSGSWNGVIDLNWKIVVGWC